jgi:diguanylate cyclase (GGDEF)-like protein/PAS domain S-box-containing protein
MGLTDLDRSAFDESSDRPDPYRLLVAAAPVAVGRLDVRRRTLSYVNDAWRVITGVELPLPIPVESLTSSIHADDRQAVEECFAAAIAHKTGFELDTRVVRRDGAVRHVRFDCAALFEPDGTLDGFVGIMLDITELIEANDAQRRSEQRYRDLIANAPVGQAAYRLDGTLVEVNAAWASLVGYDAIEVIGRNAADFVHPDHRDEALELGRQLAEAEVEAITADRRLLRRDGTAVWVSSTITVERDGQGAPVLFHSLVIDVTEKKRAEQALRESEQRYRRLVEDAPVGQIVSELDGTLVEVNNAFLAMMGSTREELFGRAPRELFHPDDLPDLAEDHRRLIRGEIDYFERERRMVRADGTIVWAAGGTTLIRESGGALLHSVVQDITERKAAEEALRESEARFRALARSLPLGVFQSSIDGRLQYVNPVWCEITGVPEAEAIGSSTLALIHPDDVDRIASARERQIRRRGSFRQQLRIVTRRGETLWVSVHATSAIDPETGEHTGFIGSMEDITPLVDAQEETARLAGIVESTSDMVGLADAVTGQLQYLNRAARELLGYEDVDVAQLTALDLYGEDARHVWDEAVVPALLAGGTWSGELPMRRADGALVRVAQTIAGQRRPDGRLTQISAVGRDVTEQRLFEATLAHQATHDALTDLPNRALLLDHLELALARAHRDHSHVALLFLDLDRFKSVNDTYGHEIGDALLVAAAARIAEMLRPADTVARLGGDEFVILCEDVVDEHHAVAIAQRVLSLIEAKPFDVRGTEIDVTASAGIAISPGGDDAHPEALLRDADAAMYRAKDLGRARLELFDESMRRRAAERLELAEELATAIDNSEIVIHYQPCVCLQSGRVTAVEALARWQHPQRGLLAPTEFIALAEDTGLIVGLGLRVLSDACTQARAWFDELGPEAPRVHVNLSARQLTAANLAVLVRGVLEGTGLDPGRLCLEITESVLMEDAPLVIDAVRRLKDIGVSLAIDDFGTGYSSLSYLRRFPVDVLKVDQSFVDGLGPDSEDSAIVAAIVNLAGILDLEAVAEGVETLEQLERLRDLGCAAAQGYLFAHPVPASGLMPLLRRRYSF